MFETILKIYRDLTGDYATQINPKTKINELNLSSLGIAQLVCEIEDRFDLEISAKDLRSFKKVQDIVSYLEKHTNS